MEYFLLFVAGIFAANGVPHFVKGITGEHHQTPFKNPSSPIVNVLWGTANIYFAAWLMRWAIERGPVFGPGSLAVLTGVLLASTLLALMWKSNPRAKGKTQD